MDNERYREIIKNGERIDWYGVTVPKDLIISNLQNAPYSLNGDVYLKKKRQIELEMEEENKEKVKKKVVKKKKVKTTITKKSSPKTRNSKLIFGK